jgi:hypothetical protein
MNLKVNTVCRLLVAATLLKCQNSSHVLVLSKVLLQKDRQVEDTTRKIGRSRMFKNPSV